MKKQIVIREPDGEQRGPYTADEAVRLMEQGALHPVVPAWNEEREEWAPLAEVISAKSPAVPDAAVSWWTKAGWVCLSIGLLTFRLHGTGFLFFAAAFAFSTVAMCMTQRHQVNHGIALSMAAFVATEFALQVLAK